MFDSIFNGTCFLFIMSDNTGDFRTTLKGNGKPIIFIKWIWMLPHKVYVKPIADINWKQVVKENMS